MKSIRMLFPVGLCWLWLWAGSMAYPQTDIAPKPILVNTCLITRNFTQLVDFYQRVLGIAPQPLISGTYAEFHTGAAVLAIFSADAQEKYIPGSTQPGTNRSAILEFKVANVDVEFARLQKTVNAFVKTPANTSWGTRSFYFRDPDGNLVDFYMPLQAEQR